MVYGFRAGIRSPEPDIVGLVYYKLGWFASKEIIRRSIKRNSPKRREDEQKEAFEKSRTSFYKLQFCSFLTDEESNVCRLLCFFSREENSRSEKAAS